MIHQFARQVLICVCCVTACQSAAAHTRAPRNAPSAGTARLVPEASERQTLRDDPGSPPLEISNAGAAASAAHEPFGLTGARVALGLADPAARWAFYCQEGSTATQANERSTATPLALRQFVDSMQGYLARSASSIRQVVAVLANSPDGRYLVIAAENREPLLYDADTDSTTSLASLNIDLRADAQRGTFRSVAFSPDGSHLALLTGGPQPRVIVRALQLGGDAVVTPVGKNVWRVAFDGSGAFIVLQEILEDTNRNGHLQWPVPERPLKNTRCTSAVGAIDAWAPGVDAITTTVAPIAGGQAKPVEGFVAAIGASMLAKRPGEGLVIEHAGRTTRLGAPDCEPHVIAVSARYGQVLTSCSDKKGRVALELASASGARVFNYEVTNSFADWTEPETERFRALYAGAHTFLVDFRSAQVSPLQDRDQVLAQGDAGLLIRRAAQVLLMSPGGARSQTLLDDVRPGTRLLAGAGHVMVGQVLLSAVKGRKIGVVESPALTVAANGCVLVALGTRQSGEPFHRGPLQWVCPGDSA